MMMMMAKKLFSGRNVTAARMARCASAVVITLVSGACVATANSASFEDPAAAKTFPVAALREDFRIFRQALEEAHPGLYAHTSKKVFDTQFNFASATLDHPMTELDFYRVLTPLIALVHCYHTGFAPSLESQQLLERTGQFFPFDVKVLAGNGYVFADFSGAAVPRGGQILTINGTPFTQVLKTLLEHAPLPTDGFELTGKYQKLGQPSRFAWNYALQIGQPAEFSLEILAPGAVKPALWKVHALTPEEIDHRREAAKKTAQHPAEPDTLGFKILDSGTAVLTIRSFQENERYPDFMRTSFAQLKDQKIQNLIVDLRGNGGGEDEYGAMLFSFLTDTDFHYYRSLEATTDHYESAHYAQPDFDQRAFSRRFHRQPDGRWLMDPEFHTGLQVQHPKANHFDGAVYFLVDGLSGSATVESAAVAHAHHRGLFIGEETGGGYAMNTSGSDLNITLPNTKLHVFVPLVQYNIAVQKGVFEHHGLVPDITVQPAISDLVNGVDREMVFTRKLIQCRGQEKDWQPCADRLKSGK